PTAEYVLQALRGARIGHVSQLDARLACEPFSRQIWQRAPEVRGVGHLAGLTLRQRDQFWQRIYAEVVAGDDHEWLLADESDWHEVPLQVERKLGVGLGQHHER